MTHAPERIWAMWEEDFGAVQMGRWADTVRFSRGGTEYIRTDAIFSDPRVAALVKAALLMVAGYEYDDDRTIRGFYGLSAALAAMEPPHDRTP